jgi:ABC-type Fe3+/spermidine/putrescine transport system ATPase subunit
VEEAVLALTTLDTRARQGTTLGPAARPHLRCAGFRKRFGDVAAVDRVDLEIDRGAFVVLLGASGCGKTTLLRMIAGLVEPDAGTLTLDGADLTRVPAASRNFGFVFQAYALFPTKTVADNIAFPLDIRGVAPADRRARVDELAALTQIGDLLGRFPHELSGGQQQRVALARALAARPSLLLLDEPLSALDARIRLRLRKELHDLVRRVGVTAIYVTHDQEEALELADRIVVMDRGRIVQDDTPEGVYLRPASRHVASFVGRATLVQAVAGPGGTVRLVEGGEIAGLRHDLAPGRACVVAIRPEFIGLVPPSDAPHVATIARQMFMGPHVRVLLDGPWGLALEAEVDHRRWRALGLGAGDRVGVELAARDIVVIADPGA